MRSATARQDSRFGGAAVTGIARAEPALALLDALPIAGAVLAAGAGGPVVLACNPRFERLLGDRRASDILLAADAPIGRAVRAHLAGADDGARLTFRWCDGDAPGGRHFEVSFARVDAAVGCRAALLSLVDRTAEVEGARTLRAELSTDSLTGLPNRAAFADAVEDAPVGVGRWAVLLVDLARFSRINDSLGVFAGDEVLITVARRLLATLRAGDLLARVGGNEFGILVRADDPAELARAADRIRTVLSGAIRLSSFQIGLDCAIGGAVVDRPGSCGEEWVRHAQRALKAAKASGRLELHRSGVDGTARPSLDLETDLRRAIDARELSLAFQPIVDLASDRPTGFEALARWQHPERGTIEPAEFIPVAEETGLIVPLGRWALDGALATLAGWDRAAGRPLPVSVSVNLSAIQLARDDVPDLVRALLAVHGLLGDRLTVELTESAVVQEPGRTQAALEALRALGVRVAMDDFGTGFSSLSGLQRLPIDVLKIDRSFVSAMLADRDKAAIVRAVLSLADALGKTITAEGVETVQLGRTLAALGCTHGQGYAYAAALAPDAALAYLRAAEI